MEYQVEGYRSPALRLNEQLIVNPSVGDEHPTFSWSTGTSLHERGKSKCDGEPVPRIAKQMAIFQYNIVILQGKFSTLSAFSIEKFEESWHIYCNSQYQ